MKTELETVPEQNNSPVKQPSFMPHREALSAVLDVLPVGLLLLNEQLCIEFSNPKVQDLLGYSASELNGLPVDRLVPDDLRSGHRNHRDAFRQDTQPRAMDDGRILPARHKQGHRVFVKIGLSPLVIADNKSVLISLIETTNDILKVAECYDPLTGLANRQLFYRMSETLRHLALRNKAGLGLLFLDLDKFKDVNDNFGHATGDELIRAVGREILAGVRKQDVVGRLGGDEFAICLYNIKDKSALERFARSLVSKVEAIDLPGHPEVQAGVSIPLCQSSCRF